MRKEVDMEGNSEFCVRGLPFPPLLVELITQGRWREPDATALQAAVLFETDPLMLLTSVESIKRESRIEIADYGEALFVARSSNDRRANELPWLDIERAFFIAVCRHAGDDIAIALDFRGQQKDPRVVASAYVDEAKGTPWREVAPTFSAFVERLGL